MWSNHRPSTQETAEEMFLVHLLDSGNRLKNQCVFYAQVLSAFGFFPPSKRLQRPETPQEKSGRQQSASLKKLRSQIRQIYRQFTQDVGSGIFLPHQAHTSKCFCEKKQREIHSYKLHSDISSPFYQKHINGSWM